jgi:hypothetical protein
MVKKFTIGTKCVADFQKSLVSHETAPGSIEFRWDRIRLSGGKGPQDMTARFEDMPLAEMVRAIDAKLDAMPGGVRGVMDVPSGAPQREETDTVARARAQLAAAEAEARRQAGNGADQTPSPQHAQNRRAGDSAEALMRAVLQALRELLGEPAFLVTLRGRAMRGMAESEPPVEPAQPPWEALGLTREVWTRLRKAGKLKED